MSFQDKIKAGRKNPLAGVSQRVKVRGNEEASFSMKVSK